MGVRRARGLLRECRVASAKRSRTQKQVGGRIDNWTAARLRLGAIWRRHPELSAEQVLKKLRPRHAVSLWWIRRMMKQCWRTAARRSPKQLRKGPQDLCQWGEAKRLSSGTTCPRRSLLGPEAVRVKSMGQCDGPPAAAPSRTRPTTSTCRSPRRSRWRRISPASVRSPARRSRCT